MVSKMVPNLLLMENISDTFSLPFNVFFYVFLPLNRSSFFSGNCVSFFGLSYPVSAVQGWTKQSLRPILGAESLKAVLISGTDRQLWKKRVKV